MYRQRRSARDALARFLETPVVDLLRPLAGGLCVGLAFWLPVIVELLRAKP